MAVGGGLLVAGGTILGVIRIQKPQAEVEQSFSKLSEEQRGRIVGALEEILQFNWEGEVDFDAAVLRAGSYEENLAGGIYQATFVVDIMEIEQSYKVNYYYLTEEQEDLFNFTTFATCLPVAELIFGDFDCKGDRQTAFMDKWQELAASLSVRYGIPWEAVVAQGILESAAGTSRFAVERNNFFGVAAYDHNPEAAYSYATPEAGWEGYFENIVRTRVYCEAGVFRGETITNPFAYLQAIKAAGYASDANYVESTAAIVRAVVARGEKKGWASSAELAESYPEMWGNAAKYACF